METVLPMLVDRLRMLPRVMAEATAVVWAMALLWTGLLLVWIYRFSIEGGGMACWDGFDRCAKAATLWVTLQQGDWGLFWEYTHNETVWPFLHAWITAGLFAWLGPHLEVARLFAWAAYGITGVLLLCWFRSEKETAPLVAMLGGLLAWMLFTTSANPIEHASSVMSELPGLMLVLVCLWLMPAPEEQRPVRLWASAFVLGLLFYYKYNYAALTYIGVAAARVVAAGFRPRVFLRYENAVLLGVPLLMFVAWLIPNFRQKWAGLTYFAVNNPEARTPFSVDFFLVYPRLIPETYFAHPVVALIAFVLVMQAIPWTRRLWLSNPVVMCFLVHVLAAVVHPMKDIRFVFIPMGLFFVLAGAALVGMLERFRLAPMGWKWSMVAALVSGCVVCAMGYQVSLHRQPHVTHDQNYRAVVYTILNQLQPEDRPAFLLAHDQVTPPVMNYYLVKEMGVVRNPMDDSPFRWEHLYMFQKGEAVRSIAEEQRFAQLRHDLFLVQANAIITVQSTQPWMVPDFERLYSGVHEWANLPPYMGEFELQYEKFFPRLEGLVRIYRLRG